MKATELTSSGLKQSMSASFADFYIEICRFYIINHLHFYVNFFYLTYLTNIPDAIIRLRFLCNKVGIILFFHFHAKKKSGKLMQKWNITLKDIHAVWAENGPEEIVWGEEDLDFKCISNFWGDKKKSWWTTRSVTGQT